MLALYQELISSLPERLVITLTESLGHLQAWEHREQQEGQAWVPQRERVSFVEQQVNQP